MPGMLHDATHHDDVTLGRWGAPSPELAEQLAGLGLLVDSERCEALEVQDRTHGVRRVYMRTMGAKPAAGYECQWILPGASRTSARRRKRLGSDDEEE